MADDVPDDVHLPLVAGHLRERQFGRDDDEDIRAERRQARKAREDAETERKIAELLDEEPTATAPSKKEAAEEEKREEAAEASVLILDPKGHPESGFWEGGLNVKTGVAATVEDCSTYSLLLLEV